MNRLLAAIGILLASTMLAPAVAQGVKVGYVSLARIEKESAAALRGIESLKQVFEPRAEQIRALQKRIAAAQAQLENERAKLPAADAQARQRELTDMMRQSDQMVLDYTEDLERRRRELRAGLIQEVRAAITVVGDAGKFDLILQEAAFAHPAVDVTDQVLKAMAK